MYSETYTETVITLIKENGEQGMLKCKPATDYSYDPVTGNTTSDGVTIPVWFVFASLSTLKDQDKQRRALQRDEGLDNLVEGRVLFYIEGNEEPTESGSLITNSAEYHFAILEPIRVSGVTVAYSALHYGVA